MKLKIPSKTNTSWQMEDNLSYLGKGVEFHGTIVTKDRVIVDGFLKGNTSAIGSLTIGKDALVEADFDVSSVKLDGEIRGNINAFKQVDISSTGRISGDIWSPVISMEPGAVINGKCSMSTNKFDRK